MSETRLGDWAARLTPWAHLARRTFRSYSDAAAAPQPYSLRGWLSSPVRAGQGPAALPRRLSPRSSFLQRIRHVEVVYRPTHPPSCVDFDLVSAKWLHMPCSKPPLSLILQALGQRSNQMVWNSAWAFAWLPCFQKSICRNRSSSAGMSTGGGGGRGGSCAQHFKHLAASASASPKAEGLFDQSDQPPGPGREAAPKIVDHCHQQAPPGSICLRAGPGP